MSDVGLRMMGKDPEGDARGVEVTDQGAVKTQVTGSKVEVTEETYQIDAESNQVFAVNMEGFKKYSLYIDCGETTKLRIQDNPRGSFNDFIDSNTQRRFIGAYEQRHIFTQKLNRVFDNHRVHLKNSSASSRTLTITIYKYA